MPDEAAREATLERFGKALADTGLGVEMVTTNLFSHPVFKEGALTANNREVRRYAVAKVLRNIDLAASLGAETFVLWGGREGAEHGGGKNVAAALDRYAESLNLLCAYVKEQGYRIRFALEPKPNEPRGDILLPTVGHALALIGELDDPSMVGLNPEVGPRGDGGPQLRPRHQPGAVARQALPRRPQRPARPALRPGPALRRRQPARCLLGRRRAARRRRRPAYDGYVHFDYKPPRAEAIDGVWESARACMRNYLILREKVQAFRADPEVRRRARGRRGRRARRADARRGRVARRPAGGVVRRRGARRRAASAWSASTSSPSSTCSASAEHAARHSEKGNPMTRPITLFTGQWADLPFEEMCRLASGWGYDGLEIACWGDHFDPWAAVEDDGYVPAKLEMLKKYDLQVFAISNHLKGQAVCDDPIDERHRGILPDRIWGDGDAEGVRQRAAEEMKMTARAARKLGVDVVIGFTGSSIWKYVAMFPPASQDLVDAGYEDFARALEPDPRRLRRRGRPVRPRGAPLRDRLRLLDDRAHHGGDRSPGGVRAQLGPQPLRVAGPRPGRASCGTSSDRIYHVDCKDAKKQVGNGRNGRLGSHLAWADPRRGWDFVSTGHGDVPWEQCFRMLNTIGYDGPISVEWEDAGMDRLVGAPEALEFVRRLAFDAPTAAFDAAFSTQE